MKHTTGSYVINMSLDGDRSEIFNKYIEDAFFLGILTVVAAGNSGEDTHNVSPASSPYAVTVGALADPRHTGSYVPAVYSNWGEELDLYAPGNDVLSA